MFYSPVEGGRAVISIPVLHISQYWSNRLVLLLCWAGCIKAPGCCWEVQNSSSHYYSFLMAFTNQQHFKFLPGPFKQRNYKVVICLSMIVSINCSFFLDNWGFLIFLTIKISVHVWQSQTSINRNVIWSFQTNRLIEILLISTDYPFSSHLINIQLQ